VKSILVGILALTIAATGIAWTQQSAAPAQLTPASPQTAPASPDLAVTMKAMEEELRSVGRLTSTETISVKGKPPYSYPVSWEPMSVDADPKTCSLRVVERDERGTHNYAIYLEEIAGVGVLTLEDSINAGVSALNNEPSFHSIVFEPSLYSVRVGSWHQHNFEFQTRESAEQFAALLRESVNQCSAVPVTPRAPAIGSPSLTETISFIADKLTAQGVVSALANMTKDDLGFSMPVGSDINISKVSSQATCVIQLNDIGMDTDEVRLSLRRIGKIEVIKLKDSQPFAGMLQNGWRITSAPSTFVLEITAPGGESKELYFSDETLANRVAKAINHAAELCGAGANKEPF